MRFAVALISVAFLFGCSRRDYSDLKEGDLIFQRSNTAQSAAITLATHSPYSHVGILLQHEGKLMVFEAVGPSKFTPLDEWIDRGKGKHFAIRRFRDSTLISQRASSLESSAEALAGKPYDWTFGWSDDKMYCSEIVWKVMQRGAGVEVCKTAPPRSFDLSSPKVRETLAARYGDHIPLDEPVVSPAQLFDSPLYYTVVK